MTEPLSEHAQSIRQLRSGLLEKLIEAERQVEYSKLDLQHLAVACHHENTLTYSTQGDRTKKCEDCGYGFY